MLPTTHFISVYESQLLYVHFTLKIAARKKQLQELIFSLKNLPKILEHMKKVNHRKKDMKQTVQKLNYETARLKTMA